MTIVGDASELDAAFERAQKCGGPVLVEEFIDGAEVNVGILDDEILGSVRDSPKPPSSTTYEAKYQRSDTRYLVPPALPDAIVERQPKRSPSPHTSP